LALATYTPFCEIGLKPVNITFNVQTQSKLYTRGAAWDTAVAESNEKDPRRGDWCRGKDGKRYHPKEWLGAKKLKRAVMADLRQYSFAEDGPHLRLRSEVAEIFARSTELMLRSPNSSQGAKTDKRGK